MASRLNAPFGARCFLTRDHNHRGIVGPMGLNAPFGARCFLTTSTTLTQVGEMVLMHLLALGAF